MISFIFIDTLLLLSVEHKVDKTMNTTDIIKDVGEAAKKLSEDIKNEFLYQDAKFVNNLWDACVFIPLR